MTYKEMNEFCKENHVYGAQVYIAEEMEYQIYDEYSLNPSSSRFEQLCERAYYLYLKSEHISMTNICKVLGRLEAAFETLTSDQNPLEMDKWDILDLAAMEE